MEKYTGNQEGFIYVSCRTSVQKEVLERYIEPLAHDGIKFYWANAFDGRAENYLRKSNALLLFLTKDFAGESKLRKTVDAATRNDKPVLTVYLEDVELDDVLSMQIESQQNLFADRYENDAEFIEALSKAEIFDNIQITDGQKRKQKGRVLLITIIALAVTLAVAGVVMQVQRGEEKEVDPTNLSKKDLNSIEMLCIVGKDAIKLDEEDIYYEVEDGETKTRIVGVDIEEVKEQGVEPPLWIRYEWDDMGGFDTSRIYYNYSHDGQDESLETDPGDISDLSDIAQMKNLKVLILAGQQIEDITPLLELEDLEYLCLACNPVSSLDGLEKLPNLRGLDINYCTNVSELPEGLQLRTLNADGTDLSSIPDFGGLHGVRFDAWSYSEENTWDVSNAGTAASYETFNLLCYSAADQLLEGLKGIPVKTLYLNGIQIDSLEEMSGINTEKLEHFGVNGSSLTSLDGIKRFEGIEELDLRWCEQLTDLSPVNELKSLKTLWINPDMEWMADAVDDRIEVVIEE